MDIRINYVTKSSQLIFRISLMAPKGGGAFPLTPISFIFMQFLVKILSSNNRQIFIFKPVLVTSCVVINSSGGTISLGYPISCQIIGFSPKFMGCRPPVWEILDPPLTWINFRCPFPWQKFSGIFFLPKYRLAPLFGTVW